MIFFAVGYGIAFGTSQGGLFGASNFFLSDAMVIADGTVDFGTGVSAFVLAFFQFAFCATAGTIATGAMAERTNFIGKIIYSFIIAAIYPVVVHWVWGGGILASLEVSFKDFAGSTVVHLLGAIVGLTGAMMLGPRKGRVWGNPPAQHNLSLAALGAFILWFGWYGFNPGSTLSMGNNGLVGLVTMNTTLAGAAGRSPPFCSSSCERANGTSPQP
ncbi:MAG: ammonium transporter [Chloroflexi bacterium]|nr:ammonium transporter [Chloroflexota bacterium]